MNAKLFSEIRTRPARALQVYQVLIGLAYNRQTMTYGQVAKILEYEGAGVFAGILDHIKHWCDQERHPALTTLIVNQTTGLPGEGFSTSTDLHAGREAVFGCNWFDIVPPTMEELSAAYIAGHK
ncbi:MULTISPECIES: hypothetical protein [unclassified Brevundimonas]|uniref:hypothetical protein n=1 Tax=unclassified Brevundimonas TaxID=2622653 RepID=UPI0025C69E3E|nr:MULTISPECIES: hypothetical protein [unclassified Brevundimonas]